MKLIDPSHPIYRPLWVRLLITGVCLGWAAFEYAQGATTWAMIFGALGAYAGWVLLIAWPGKDGGNG